jgi:hypothetical protein
MLHTPYWPLTLQSPTMGMGALAPSLAWGSCPRDD